MEEIIKGQILNLIEKVNDLAHILEICEAEIREGKLIESELVVATLNLYREMHSNKIKEIERLKALLN